MFDKTKDKTDPDKLAGLSQGNDGIDQNLDKAVNTRQIVVNTQSECRQELTRLTHAKIMSDKTTDMSDTQSPCLSK